MQACGLFISSGVSLDEPKDPNINFYLEKKYICYNNIVCIFTLGNSCRGEHLAFAITYYQFDPCPPLACFIRNSLPFQNFVHWWEAVQQRSRHLCTFSINHYWNGKKTTSPPPSCCPLYIYVNDPNTCLHNLSPKATLSFFV